MESLNVIELPPPNPRSVELFPSDITYIELVNNPGQTYEAEWKLTLWEGSPRLGKWRTSTHSVSFARLADLGSLTAWNIRWSYLVVKEALDALTIPGHSGLARCLPGSREPQELRFRVYLDGIKVYRLDDATVWKWYRRTCNWAQLR